MDYYGVIHSHVAPGAWAAHYGTPRNLRFAAMRHPAGTLTSACFSLNALASEYIQRFVSADQDNDTLRQRLALYKLSDLKFFEALLPPFLSYLEEFAGVEGEYTLMRWEDLLLHPAKTVAALARGLGVEPSPQEIEALWARLDHVNLTGAHKHNLRQGHGIISGWKRWITNTHLGIMRDYGFERFSLRYGYGPLVDLDETDYTPFQKQLSELLRGGEVFRGYGDEDLFGFAFNKSNIDFSGFGFRSYPWRQHTCIERSSFRNERLVLEVSDAAERACAQFNAAVRIWLEAAQSGRFDGALPGRMAASVADLYDDEAKLEGFRRAMARALPGAEEERCLSPGGGEPVLLQSRGTINIVQFRGRYYAVPQSLGPVDFFRPDLADVAFAGTADSLTELASILESA